MIQRLYTNYVKCPKLRIRRSLCTTAAKFILMPRRIHCSDRSKSETTRSRSLDSVISGRNIRGCAHCGMESFRVGSRVPATNYVSIMVIVSWGHYALWNEEDPHASLQPRPHSPRGRSSISNRCFLLSFNTRLTSKKLVPPRSVSTPSLISYSMFHGGQLR